MRWGDFEVLEETVSDILRPQLYEPLLIVGLDKFAGVDIRVRVTGGGHTSQIYAIRQAIAKSLVAYYQKFVDEYAKNQLKAAFVAYDRTLLVADPRRTEPKVCSRRYIPRLISEEMLTFCVTRNSVVQEPVPDTKSLTVKIPVLLRVEMGYFTGMVVLGCIAHGVGLWLRWA